MKNVPLHMSVCIVGLGYVGLPLLYKFAEAGFSKERLCGFDVNVSLVEKLSNGKDHTGTIPKSILRKFSDKVQFTTDIPVGYDVYIVCVPTPDRDGSPDYSYVEAACRSVGSAIKDGSVVIVESTIAPGAMNSRVVPIIRGTSDAKKFVPVFSPERVDPGPRSYDTMTNCTKVVAVCRSGAFDLFEVKSVYASLYDDVLVVNDFRVAELAKVFENAQRDANIALMNELSEQCYRNGVDYAEVIEALRTKKSSPVFLSGLVGGHCIPVDPYYLLEWYDGFGGPFIPAQARERNDHFIKFSASVVANEHRLSGRAISDVLILGKTYKKDVPDTRNSGALILAEHLSANRNLNVHHVDFLLGDKIPEGVIFDIVVGAVNHGTHSHVPVGTYASLAIDCTFINLGGFCQSQLRGHFDRIIQL